MRLLDSGEFFKSLCEFTDTDLMGFEPADLDSPRDRG